MNRTLHVLACVVGLGGCSSTDDAPAGGSFAGGKADTGGLQEGTDDARRVLGVANSVTRNQLVSEVNVPSNVADNIVAFRLGDDGAAGTDDDAYFDSLAELDAIPFVGPLTFQSLLTYTQTGPFVGYGIGTCGSNADCQSCLVDGECADGINPIFIDETCTCLIAGSPYCSIGQLAVSCGWGWHWDADVCDCVRNQ